MGCHNHFRVCVYIVIDCTSSVSDSFLYPFLSDGNGKMYEIKASHSLIVCSENVNLLCEK